MWGVLRRPPSHCSSPSPSPPAAMPSRIRCCHGRCGSTSRRAGSSPVVSPRCRAEESKDSTASNSLTVEVGATTTRFLVNDKEVHRAPASTLKNRWPVRLSPRARPARQVRERGGDSTALVKQSNGTVLPPRSGRAGRLRRGARRTYFFCAGCPPSDMPSSTLSTFVVAGS